MVMLCNAGKAFVTKKGDLKSYGTVWLYPDNNANNLSLCDVQNRHKVKTIVL